MAIYTKLSENNLKEFFLKYNLGKLLNYKGIQEGIENTNFSGADAPDVIPIFLYF